MKKLIEARISVVENKLFEMYGHLGRYNYYKSNYANLPTKGKTYEYYRKKLDRITYYDSERTVIPPHEDPDTGEYMEGVDDTHRDYTNLKSDIRKYEKELKELESILIEKGWY